jgi:UDP-N-acetylglucosamine 2-epimerase (non-hydrolysing)
MPEEINRVVTDRLSDLLFTPSQDADANLVAEGVPPERVHFVGNVMIDTLALVLPAARERVNLGTWSVRERGYVVATLHRPSNVDERNNLGALIGALREMSREWPVIFPVHPRPSGMSRCSASSIARDSSSPIQAGCRRRQPFWECHALQFVRTQNAR